MQLGVCIEQRNMELLTFYGSRSTLLTTASENKAFRVHRSEMFYGFITETSVCADDNDGFPSEICTRNWGSRHTLVADHVQRSVAHVEEVVEKRR